MTAPASLVRESAQLMTERHGGDLDSWIKQVRGADLTELRPFLTGLDQNHDAAVAGLTLPSATVPSKASTPKMIKRQIYGRADSSSSATESCWHTPESGYHRKEWDRAGRFSTGPAVAGPVSNQADAAVGGLRRSPARARTAVMASGSVRSVIVVLSS